MQKWFIYILRDPRDQSVRYVGATTKVKARLYAHIGHAAKAKHRVGRWIASLLALSLRPSIEVIEEGCGPGDDDAEIRWIAHYRASGAELTNESAGGRGVSRVCPPDVRAKISVSNTGKVRSAEQRAHLRSMKLGTTASASTRQKMSAAHMGHSVSDKARAALDALADARRGVPLSAEAKAKISAKLTGRKMSEEARAKMIASHKARHAAGNVVSQESREKMAASRRGLKLSDAVKAERRAKMAARKSGQLEDSANERLSKEQE